MKKRVLFFLYQNIPTGWRFKIAGLKWLAPLRDKILRKGNSFQEVEVEIKRKYNDFVASFTFAASYQVAAKAEKKGVESALLRKSLSLIEKRLGDKKNTAVIMDIGANFGFLSLVWGTFATKGKVYAIEPEPRLMGSIKKSIRKNNLSKTIIPLNIGASNRVGELDLYTFPGGSSGNIEQGHTEVIRIKTDTIDNIVQQENINQLDLLKIDVDSIEEKILNGGAVAIKRFKPIIITETNKSFTLISFLKDLAYNLYDVNGKAVDIDEMPHDIIAIPSTIDDQNDISNHIIS